MENNSSKKTYSVAYRTGGTLNYKWNRVLESYATRELAQASADGLDRMGYKALVYNTYMLDSIGMPDTYEVA